MDNEAPQDEQQWLKELASKTWSLEMTISGAATFAVSYLPDLIERGLDYYLDNLAPSIDGIGLVFPLLAYAFFKVMAWLLTCTFIVHLSMRALWVGAVGLHAVFPKGIQYPLLSSMSDEYKALAEQHYGSLADFIYRLDKQCNRIFALAFTMAMSLGGLGLLYLIIFMAYVMLRRFFSDDVVERMGWILYLVFLVAITVVFSTKYWPRKQSANNHWALRAAHIQLFLTRFTLPIFSHPLTYLSMAFMSNVPKYRYYGALTLISIGMMTAGIVVMAQKMSSIRGRSLMDPRTYYWKGAPEGYFPHNRYDNLRDQGSTLPRVSISSDVVEGDFLPLFVKYPYYLDAQLRDFCPPASVPEQTLETWSKKSARQYKDSLSLDCLQQFFRVTLNDSATLKVDWLFAEKSGVEGIVTYIDAQHFQRGKNTLLVQLPSEAKKDSLVEYGFVPFWYSTK
jgi:hypothetical protein